MTAVVETISVPQTRRLTGRDFYIALAFAAVAALISFDAWKSIFTLAYLAEELSYCLLAPVVICWIASSMKSRWAQCQARSAWPGILLLLTGFGCFVYGYLADPVIWRAGAVFMTVGAFLSAVGSDVFFKFLPVFGACLFLIPVHPNSRFHLAQPLEVATAQATQVVCDLIGIGVERSGNLISINGVPVTVAEACNGMRMVFTLFLVCYLVAFTEKLKPIVRLLILVAAPVVAILANITRLIPTIWIYGHYSQTTAERFHDGAGWCMIVIAFLGLLGLCRVSQQILAPRQKLEVSPA